MGKVTVRIFGSSECEKCRAAIALLDFNGIKYQYVDAFDFNDEHAYALCERYEVDDIPHIQLLDGENVVRDLVWPFDLAGLIHSLSRG